MNNNKETGRNPIDFAPRNGFQEPKNVPDVPMWQRQGRRTADLGTIDKSARKLAERQALNRSATETNASQELAPEMSQLLEPLPIRNPHKELTPLQERLREQALEELSKPRDRDVSNA